MVYLNDDIEKSQSSDSENVTYDNDSDVDIVISRPKVKNVILTDDELSDDETSTVANPISKQISLSSKIDDSSDEESTNFIIDKPTLQQSKSRILSMDSDSDSDSNENVQEEIITNNNSENKTNYTYDKTIFDTETSDDEMRQDFNVDSTTNISENSPNLKKSFKKKPNDNKTKENECSIQKIHSESQRMIRESEISLPYHRPKQRSLADFINRNSKNQPVQKKKISLKMSMRDINVLRQIEEQKKNIESFYESGSDEEDEAPVTFNIHKEVKSISEDAVNSDTDFTEDNLPCLDFDVPICRVESDILVPVVESESNLPTVESESNLPAVEIESDLHAVETESCKSISLSENNSKVMQNNCEDKNDDSSSNLLSIAKNTEINESDLLSNQDLEYKTKNLDKSLNKWISSTPTSLFSSNSKDLTNTPKDQLSLDEEMNSLPDKDLQNLDKIDFKDTIDEDSEDFKLHLETEEMDDLSLQFTEETQNFNQMNSSKFVTPKINSIISKFPKFDVSKLINSTPTLSSSGNNNFIEFDSDEDEKDKKPESFKSGVSILIDRLVKHSIKKKKRKDESLKLSIVSKEKDFHGEEKLISSDIFINDSVIEEKCTNAEPIPGAQFVKLKTALKAQLMKRRGLNILRRQKEKQFIDCEEVIEDFDDDLPDDEPILTDESDTEYETESEPEENDIIVTDKKRQKNQYLDEEAEDSDDVDDNSDQDDNVNDDSGQDDDEQTTNSKKESNLASDDDDDSIQTQTLNSRRKITDDDDDNAVNMMESYSHDKDDKMGKRASIYRASTEDLFCSQSQDGLGKKDRVSSSLSMNASLELMGSLIPGAQPEGSWNNVDTTDSVTEDEFNNSSLSLFSKLDCLKRLNSTEERDKNRRHLDLILTPMKNSQLSNESQKRNLSNEVCSSNQDELLGLCSGKFTDRNSVSNEANGLCDDEFTPTQDINELMGLCSGFFAPKTQPSSESELNNEPSLSQNFEKEPKSKLTMLVLSSDEENNSEKLTNRKKKKRKRIVAMSDEEDNDAVSVTSLTDEEIEYDEDERPIIKSKFGGFKDAHKGGIRSDFLDKEAELSGSEEGSDDELEPDEAHDLMEHEEGDNEYFDEDDLRNQVGKAHMKSLMDADKREVKLLQELYFEDGDLHGKGRKRNFRWTNNNKMDEENDDENHSEEEKLDEDSTIEKEAAERRKLKLERQKSINESNNKQMSPSKDIFALKTCHSLPIVRSRSVNLLRTSNSTHSACSPFLAGTTSSNHRSFFLRDSSALERLSDKMKENATTSVKQSGNFVFHSLTSEEVEKKEVQNRRKSQGPAAKKSRVERNFFAANHSANNNSSVFKDL